MTPESCLHCAYKCECEKLQIPLEKVKSYLLTSNKELIPFMFQKFFETYSQLCLMHNQIFEIKQQTELK